MPVKTPYDAITLPTSVTARDQIGNTVIPIETAFSDYLSTTSFMHGRVTSLEIVEATSAKTMPSASPITDVGPLAFPNTFMEPEMLSFEFPSSVSKRFGPSGRSAFSAVGPSAHFERSCTTPTTTTSTTTHIHNDSTNANLPNNSCCSPNRNNVAGLDDAVNGENLSRFAMGIHGDMTTPNNNNNNNFINAQGFHPIAQQDCPQFSICKSSDLCHLPPGVDADSARDRGLRNNADKSFHIYPNDTRPSVGGDSVLDKNGNKSSGSFANNNVRKDNKGSFQHPDSDGVRNGFGGSDTVRHSVKRNDISPPCKTRESNAIGHCSNNSPDERRGSFVTNEHANPNSFHIDQNKVYTNMDSTDVRFENNISSISINGRFNESVHPNHHHHPQQQHHHPPHHFLISSSHHHQSTPPPSSIYTSTLPSSSSSSTPLLYSSSSSSTTISPPPSSSPSCMYLSHPDIPPNESSHLNSVDPTRALSMTAASSHPITSGNSAPSSHNQNGHLYVNNSTMVLYTPCQLSQAQPSSRDVVMSDSLSNDGYPMYNDENDDGDDDDSCSSRIRKKNFPCESTDSFLQDENDDSAMSWTLKAPQFWSSSEVLDWLFYVAQEQSLDMQELRAENFQSVSGERLCLMEREDFVRLEPTFGNIIHEMLNKLLSGEGYVKQETNTGCYGHSMPSPTYSSHSDSSHFDIGCPSTNQSQPFHETTPLFADIKQEDPSCIYRGDVPPPGHYFKQEQPDNPSIHFTPYNYDMSDSTNSCLSVSQGLVYPGECYVYQGTPYPHAAPPVSHSHPSSSIRAPCCYSAPPPPPTVLPPPSTLPPPPTLPRRKPGRPRVKNVVQAAKGSKDKKAKNQHLWEFIYEILMNPLYNPQYLKWENQREGVFRFVQSEAVAQLWGGRKNNENMTYEKLSRAMRHYYRRGILERVEGRRLVYKFSLKAIDRMKVKKSNSNS